jgi:hydroxyacylglutathione hydrolase
MALTGDTLFVGDIGRPDLIGLEEARSLADQMYDTIHQEILPLPDGVMVFPGHGAGSLCGKSIGAVRSSTIGFERHNNPALFPRERVDFVDFAVAELPEQPANAKRIKAMNRRGPRPLGEIHPQPITIQDSINFFQSGAALLDVRAKDEYKTQHIPGSVHLELDDQLSNRIGFVLPPEVPIILLLPGETPEEITGAYSKVIYALARVGYDSVTGYLAESLDVWEAYGLPLTSGDIQDIEPKELHKLLESGNGDAPIVLDVREPWEFAQGHIPGAELVPLGELIHRVGELEQDRPVAVICATGSRSQSAAALLGREGFETIYNVLGGTSGWKQNGLPIVR